MSVLPKTPLKLSLIIWLANSVTTLTVVRYHPAEPPAGPESDLWQRIGACLRMILLLSPPQQSQTPKKQQAQRGRSGSRLGGAAGAPVAQNLDVVIGSDKRILRVE